MSLVAGGKKVGGDVSGARDIGDDFDFLRKVRKFGEEFRFGVALEKVFGDRVPGMVGGGEFFHVGVVKEDLGFKDLGSFSGDFSLVAEGKIQEDLH